LPAITDMIFCCGRDPRILARQAYRLGWLSWPTGPVGTPGASGT
jgi:hypothetical protein